MEDMWCTMAPVIVATAFLARPTSDSGDVSPVSNAWEMIIRMAVCVWGLVHLKKLCRHVSCLWSAEIEDDLEKETEATLQPVVMFRVQYIEPGC